MTISVSVYPLYASCSGTGGELLPRPLGCGLFSHVLHGDHGAPACPQPPRSPLRVRRVWRVWISGTPTKRGWSPTQQRVLENGPHRTRRPAPHAPVPVASREGLSWADSDGHFL